MLLYSGYKKENAPHTQGVVLMLSKEARETIIGLESHGPRIIKESFITKKKGITMNMLCSDKILAKSKPKLKKQWTTGQSALQKFNAAFLRNTEKLKVFKIALNNRFQALQDLLKEEEITMKDI
ncbi:unnamed protein product [Schistosoma margrebowiei]|uniref:Uncharacterized protein n=1 Tax=Schistosoma margrebowiei TaxID=48269 RepID=A0A183LSL9_9TREM|nr:unnamed protein product [Schistosoma margrebowiei]